MKICRHCHKCKVTRPRGLCWNCYYRPGVRELYPSTSKFAHRGLGHGHQRPPAVPTSAPPGSTTKLEILEMRARAGEQLFHPLDAPDWSLAAEAA